MPILKIANKKEIYIIYNIYYCYKEFLIKR
jgi:hypothetical protein